MEKALYKGVDFKEISAKDMAELEKGESENINIVYPFYSYEDRNLLSSNYFSYATEYYIPASSLKGALLGSKKDEAENNLRNKILFQDIRINNSSIKLRNLYKFQYLYQEIKEKGNNEKREILYKTPQYATFFPRVAVEMMEREKGFEGEIRFKEAEIIEEFFKRKLYGSFDVTKKKLKNYIEEIENRIKAIDVWIRNGKIKKQEQENEDYINKLKEIKRNIQGKVHCDKNIVFLGGYKGLLGSLSQLDDNHKFQNGFYVDQVTLLPYGLVEVNIESDTVD